MQPSYSSRGMTSKRSAFEQHNPLLRVPIIVRLFLGFLILAIIASTAGRRFFHHHRFVGSEQITSILKADSASTI